MSLYSWFGFTNILRYRPVLNSHDVEVEILPFVLGAARNEADNPFGPAPQVKAIYAGRDSATVGRLLGLKVVPPKQFPVSSMTVSIFIPKQKREEWGTKAASNKKAGVN